MFIHDTWCYERRHYVRNVIAILCVMDFIVGAVLFCVNSQNELMVFPAVVIVVVTMLCLAVELVHLHRVASWSFVYAASIIVLTFLAIVAMIVALGLFINAEMPLAAFFIMHGTVLAVVLALRLLNERRSAAVHATPPSHCQPTSSLSLPSTNPCDVDDDVEKGLKTTDADPTKITPSAAAPVTAATPAVAPAAVAATVPAAASAAVSVVVPAAVHTNIPATVLATVLATTSQPTTASPPSPPPLKIEIAPKPAPESIPPVRPYGAYHPHAITREPLHKPIRPDVDFPVYPTPDPTPQGRIDRSENVRWNVPPLNPVEKEDTNMKDTSLIGRLMGSDLPRAPHREYSDEERYAPNTRTGGDPEAIMWDRTDGGFDSACMG